MKIYPTFVSQVSHPERQATIVLLSQLTSQRAIRVCVPAVYAGFPAADCGKNQSANELWQRVTIRRSGCGLASPPGDANGLAAAIQQVWNAPSTTERMGRQAAQANAIEYTLSAAVDELEAHVLLRTNSGKRPLRGTS